MRATAYGAHATVVGLALLPASIAAGVLWEHVSHAAPFVLGGGARAARRGAARTDPAAAAPRARGASCRAKSPGEFERIRAIVSALPRWRGRGARGRRRRGGAAAARRSRPGRDHGRVRRGPALAARAAVAARRRAATGRGEPERPCGDGGDAALGACRVRGAAGRRTRREMRAIERACAAALTADGAAVVGGNLSATDGPAWWCVTLIGEVERGTALDARGRARRRPDRGDGQAGPLRGRAGAAAMRRPPAIVRGRAARARCRVRHSAVARARRAGDGGDGRRARGGRSLGRLAGDLATCARRAAWAR